MSGRSGLDRLLRPRHIAVFGGSWAENVVRQCLAMNFQGPIWPVNPKRTEICGIPCLRSAADLPEAPDACFVGVNRSAAPGIIRELAEMGAGGAVCFASGFAESEIEEAGASLRQEELRSAAGDMTLLGPNCYGFVNYLDSVPLWPDQHGGERCERGVAIVSQSSNIAINLTMQARSLPLAYIVTVGNQCQTDLADIASALLDDPRVTALGLHVEGFGDLRKFELIALKSRRLRKPVAVIKAGKSQKARATTVSHTGTIAGSDTMASALLDRLGIARLDSIPALLETLKLLHAGGPMEGRRIGSLSCSGGEACLMADAAHESPLQFPDLTQDQGTALRRALGPRVHLANPLDYHTYLWKDREALTSVFSAMLSGDYDLMFLVMDFPRQDRCSDIDWHPAVEAIECAARGSGKRVALLATLPECLPREWGDRLLRNGIVPMQGVAEALQAAAAAALIGEAWGRAPPEQLLIAPVPAGETETLDESRSKSLLAAHGMQVPASRTAQNGADAAIAADKIGYPVVLKSLGTAHKSDSGGVRTGLCDAAAVAGACREMPAGEGFLVEAEITGDAAEIMLGIVRDESGAFVLTVGAGGVFAELFGDSQSLLLPFSDDEFLAALGRLRCGRLLDGYRGQPGKDRNAVLAAARAMERCLHSDIDAVLEVEVNPFLVCKSGGFAVDALIVRRATEEKAA